MINDLNDIDISTEEGKMLMAALAKITTESQTDKTTGQVIAQLNELKDHMYAKDENPSGYCTCTTPSINSMYATKFCNNCQRIIKS